MVNRRQVIKSGAAAATVLAMPKYAFASSAFTGFYPAGSWIAAKQAMIRVYPRPDSETNTWARHRWAYYDGANPVQYKIPLGVSFGAFPYVFQLLSGPPGMTIGATYWQSGWSFAQAAAAGYGYVQWTPTASVSGATVSILVTDQQQNTLTITFTISTSGATSRFIFVDAVNGNDSNAGSIGAPFKTLSKALGPNFATTTNAGTICYLRGTGGTYTPPISADQDINSYWTVSQLDTTRKPSALIGFPGDPAQPVVSMASSMFGSYGSGASDNGVPDLFISNINFNGYNTSQPSFRLFWLASPGAYGSRITFEGNVWTNAGYGSSAASNTPGYFFDGNTPNLMLYGFIKNCQETRVTGGFAGNNIVGCDVYGVQYMLVEGNTSNTPNLTVNGCWIYKSDVSNSCMRGNFAAFAACAYPYSFLQDPLSGTHNNEVCYNKYIGLTPAGNNGIFFPVNDPGVGMAAGNMTNLWAYRNSVIGMLGSNDPNAGGPYVFQNNVVQGTYALPSGTAVQTSGNVTAASGALDTTYCNLTGTYTSYLGTVGAQIVLASSGATPTPNAPVLKVLT